MRKTSTFFVIVFFLSLILPVYAHPGHSSHEVFALEKYLENKPSNVFHDTLIYNNLTTKETYASNYFSDVFYLATTSIFPVHQPNIFSTCFIVSPIEKSMSPAFLSSDGKVKEVLRQYALTEKYRDLIRGGGSCIPKYPKYISSLIGKFEMNNVVLNEFFSSLTVKDQLLVQKAIEGEISSLASHLTMSDLVNLTEYCDTLHSSLKFACYKPLIEKVATMSQDNIDLFSEIVLKKYQKKKFSVLECHFVNHQLGYSLAHSFTSLEEIHCPTGSIDGCSQGCLHGAGEYLSQKNPETLVRLLDDEQSYDVYNFFHGYGHNIFSKVRELNASLNKCKVLGEGSSSYNSCRRGVFHQLFSERLTAQESIDEMSGLCESIKEENECYASLGTTSVYHFGAHSAVAACIIRNNSPCARGVGFGIHATDERNVASECLRLFSNSSLLDYCYAGMVSYDVLHNNMTHAYLQCQNTGEFKRECMGILKGGLEFFPFYNDKVSVCLYVDQEFRTECYRDILHARRVSTWS